MCHATPPKRWFLAALLLATAVLAGCSTARVVEGEVLSFSTLTTAPQPSTYRLERLPSQHAQPTEFDALAVLAEQSLLRIGLQRDDEHPALLVQLTTQAGYTPRQEWVGAPRWSIYSAWGAGRYGRPHGLYGPHGLWGMGGPTPLIHRAVSLVMRDAQTQQVVYETSAVHDDVWTRDPAVYGALMDAALSGFPTPTIGTRQVKIPLPPVAP